MRQTTVHARREDKKEDRQQQDDAQRRDAQLRAVQQGPDYERMLAMSRDLDAKLALVDLSFDLNGSKIQPTGSTTLKIPLAEEAVAYHYLVYRIDEDGQLVQVPCMVKDGHLVITADHFSLYAVLYADHALTGGDSPETGDGSAPLVQLLVGGSVALCLLAAGAVKRRQRV